MDLGRTVIPNRNGFSLVELLVALVLSGILLTIIASTISNVSNTSYALDDRAEGAKRQLALRRLFHRDLQNITTPDTFEFTGSSISFETTHSTLLDGPFPVQVTWNFGGGKINRVEKSENIGYADKNILSEGIEN